MPNLLHQQTKVLKLCDNMQKGIIRQMIVLMTAAVLISGFPGAIQAQEYENTPVSISSEKIKIKGKVCYSHIVLEKQTLFSICKAYNVTPEDIYEYNPTVKEKGLQKNSILIIPVIENEIPEKEDAKTPADKAGQAQKLEIEATAETSPAESHQEGGDEEKTVQRTHTVKWYEDLDTIARKYGVTVEEIMRANGLTGRKLTKRQKLIIPFPGEMPEEEVPSVETLTDSTQTKDTLAQEKEGFLDYLLFPKKEVALSLILPLNADGTSVSQGNMDFYSGVLLAVYDMAQSGTSCDLNVYDIASGTASVPAETLEKSDVIIGPVSSYDIEQTFELAPESKAIVSPLDQRVQSLVSTYAGMIQAPTPLMTQYEDLMEWIREDMQYSDRFIVITEKGGKETEVVAQMRAAADSSGIEYKHLSYSILEGRNVTGSLEYIMTESGTNRVYIASDSEAFVNDVVRNINLMIHKKYDVALYAPGRIRNYDTIEVENFHNASLHVSTGYYIDYDDPRVKEFLLKYRALYNTEPTQFAFQGYDLAKYFIGLNAKYGNRWFNRLEEADESLLQSTFRFRKSGDGGYINTGVRRIIYNEEWTITKIR